MSKKYAVGEYERRFLLDEVPDDAYNPRRITDFYLTRTRLRVRSVEEADGTVGHKLGHKRRVADADPTAIMHTSLYLDEAEHEVLASLPSQRLVKTRWAIDLGGTIGSVNEFAEALTGLIMLEVDLGAPELLARFQPPRWVGPEVTMDEAFTGGRLAGCSVSELAEPLARARAIGP